MNNMTAVNATSFRIDCVICQGKGSNDARRVVELMEAIDADYRLIFVDKSKSMLSRPLDVFRQLQNSTADFIFMEGTGIGGGLAVMAHSASRSSIKYLVSSGDAVDSFIRNQHGPLLGWVASMYERVLYRRSFAFVGWSPYLVGRAFRMGAQRGFTLEGAVPAGFQPARSEAVLSKREELGIQTTDLVIGISGSLMWSERQAYCYGMELANAGPYVARRDVRFLVVGDGSGLAKIKDKVADDSRFILTGRVPHDEMPLYLGLMDAAVISQTSDESGALRLTTKLPEYLFCGVPVAMPAIPGAIDYLQTANAAVAWTLPTEHPASQSYAKAVASWIDGLSLAETGKRRNAAVSVAEARFKLSLIAPRLADFLRATGP